MARWPTIRRNKSLRPPSPSPSLQTKDGGCLGRAMGSGSNSGGGGENTRTESAQPGCGSGSSIMGSTMGIHTMTPRLHPSTSQDSVGRDENSLHDLCDEDDGTIRWQQLTPKHKAAIRAIRKVRPKN